MRRSILSRTHLLRLYCRTREIRPAALLSGDMFSFAPVLAVFFTNGFFITFMLGK